jgi:hypothetical protein
MKAKHIGMVLVVFAVIGLIGYSTASYAGWGRGGGPGAGYCQRGGYGGPGFGGNLTDEEIGVLQKERNAFFESTQDLREKLYQKNLELRAEVAKQNPDAKKAAELQKEISDLDSALDQKRLDHQLKMKKDYPQIYGKGFGGGFGPRGGMGPGHGRGPGWGGCPGGGPYQQ